MGNFRSLPTQCWENFLTYKGFKHSRTRSSHHQWTKYGYRTIPVWGDEKEIPAFHFKKRLQNNRLHVRGTICLG